MVVPGGLHSRKTLCGSNRDLSSLAGDLNVALQDGTPWRRLLAIPGVVGGDSDDRHRGKDAGRGFITLCSWGKSQQGKKCLSVHLLPSALCKTPNKRASMGPSVLVNKKRNDPSTQTPLRRIQYKYRCFPGAMPSLFPGAGERDFFTDYTNGESGPGARLSLSVQNRTEEKVG